MEGIYLRRNGIRKEEVKQYKRDIISENDTLCLLAKIGQEVVGCLNFSRYDKAEYQHCGEFGMSVFPECWKKGIGTSLVLEMEKWCRTKRVEKIELSVWSNNQAAIRLYKKQKYLTEGKRKNSIIRDSKSYDLVLMGKWIG